MFSLVADDGSFEPSHTLDRIIRLVESYQPKISVLTPTYNHGRYIARAIESVVAQSYPNWEMIVLDDGSSDDTVEIARTVDDERVRVIEEPHRGIGGLAETYNRGLSESSGELVAILEGDDFWPPDKLQRQVADFADPKLVLSSGITEIVDEHGVRIGQTPEVIPDESMGKNDPVGIAAFRMMSPHVTTFTFPVSTIIRRTALEKIGGFIQPSYLPLVDYPTFLKIAVEGEFRFHEETLGYWMRHQRSITRSRFPEIIEGVYRYAMLDFLPVHREMLPVSNDQVAELELLWEHFLLQLCVLRGRMLAAKGKWREATQAFREGNIYRMSGKTKKAIQIGVLLTKFKLSPEAMFRLVGQKPWDEMAYMPSGDAYVSEDDLRRERPVPRRSA